MGEPQPGTVSRSSLALANLRAFVILLVVAFHSMLAYVSWNPPLAMPFDSPPYRWLAFPIVDSHRWFGFDLFCAWQDVYLMSLLFFLSGLFVWPSLCRKKEWVFLRDRVVRLGVPYAFGVAILMPLATYPAYAVRSVDPSVLGYWHALLALPCWPNGPLWFLWQLLALNIIAVAVHFAVPNAIQSLGRWSVAAENYFGRFLLVLVAASALAYIPLAVLFTPWAWTESGIFALQFCRPLLYAVYFFAGIGIGVAGIERGLVPEKGVLARHWAMWLAASLVSLSLWMGLTALTMNGADSVGIEIAADFGFVVAAATGCFFLLAVSLRFATKRSRVLDSLSGSAYGVYLIHYGFVVWLQYALLTATLFAVIKAAIVFSAALALSWITTLAVQRIAFGARLFIPPQGVATL